MQWLVCFAMATRYVAFGEIDGSAAGGGGSRVSGKSHFPTWLCAHQIMARSRWNGDIVAVSLCLFSMLCDTLACCCLDDGEMLRYRGGGCRWKEVVGNRRKFSGDCVRKDLVTSAHGRRDKLGGKVALAGASEVRFGLRICHLKITCEKSSATC